MHELWLYLRDGMEAWQLSNWILIINLIVHRVAKTDH